MNIWDNFWNRNQSQNLLYKIGRILPAGPWDFYWRWKRYQRFLNLIKIKNPRILEIGCGTGVMTFKMLERYGGEAILLDKSNNAIKLARQHSKFFDINKKSIKYISKDIFNFNDKKKFDIVHSQGLIEHFNDQSEIINEHFRLTKNNGYVIILAPRPSFFYNLSRNIFRLYRKKWIFGYENPLETEKVIYLIKQNPSKVIKKKNFIFSMGCISQKI